MNANQKVKSIYKIDEFNTETAVLNLLLWNQKLIPSFSKDIKHEYFRNLKNRVIFNKIITLHKRKIKFNFLSLSMYFEPWQNWVVSYIYELANYEYPKNEIEIYKARLINMFFI
ncbi:MAG: DnaB-like helicase N-terminal domain-containing protein [Candidatus Gastranaerophilales bacterium]|nr:DnaB-like helicase N-terminal domain-containing protein [Candidatus Gastranaerophilales bacterium]